MDMEYHESKTYRHLRNQIATYLIAIITLICMISTIVFAYNSSLETPLLPTLVAKSPERTILILNIMSQVTLFSLAELTTVTMDATRWALAGSTTGTSALTFLALSKATTLLGALVLSIRNGKSDGNSHRIWSMQR